MKNLVRTPKAMLALLGAMITVTACFSDDANPGNTAGSGGTGGSGTGSGGSGGGGPSTGQDSAPPENVDLIDNMEDMDGSIMNAGGRVGAWYTYNDATSMNQTPKVATPFTMTPGGRDGMGYAANTQGDGFTLWGAGFGFNLKDPGTADGGSAKASYDASAYTGISFWAKVGPTSVKAVRINVSNKDTDPIGGVCPDALMKCNDHFGNDETFTTEWKSYTLPFSKMAQAGWSMTSVAKFDASTLYAIQFQVAKNTTFDLWLDDVAFTK